MGDGRYRAKQDRLDRARQEENARLNQAARGSLLTRLVGTPARVNATGERGVVRAMNRVTGEVTLDVAGEERTYRGVELTLEGLP
jgi:hypothetical protein